MADGLSATIVFSAIQDKNKVDMAEFVLSATIVFSAIQDAWRVDK